MGAFVAVLALDGAPIPSLSSAIAGIQPDSYPVESWRVGDFSYARSTFAAAAWNQKSQIPRRPGLPLCVADVRLDHREELIGSLGAGVADCNQSDAELIAAAYRHWGADCVRHLKGDFAFVIWDEAGQRLWGASDPLGVRTLSYAVAPDAILVGSRLRLVGTALGTPVSLNSAWMRKYLQNDFGGAPTDTAFSRVRRLRPGFLMTFRPPAREPVVTRYCTVGAQRQDTLSTDGAYLDRMSALLYRSVKSRLATTGPVGLTLSGGLDSSAIVAHAATAMRIGAPVTDLRTYSWVFRSTPNADESEFQKAVLDHYPELRPTTVHADDLWYYRSAFDGLGSTEGPCPYLGQLALLVSLLRRASADGCRTLLLGNYSDELLGSGVGRDHFVDSDYSRWPAEMRRLAREVGLHHMVREIRQAIIAIRRHRLGKGSTSQGPLSPSLPSVGGMISYASILSGRSQISREYIQGVADRFALEVRFPFLDRDLVEFGLHLPASMRVRVNLPKYKYVLRESLQGLLPELVRRRTTMAYFDALRPVGFARERARMISVLRNSHVESAGLISEAELSALIQELRMGTSSVVPARAERVLEVEGFLRLFGEPSEWTFSRGNT